MASFTYENHRYAKIVHTFTGAANDGANGTVTTLDNIPTLDIGEYIYDVFYRVTTPFTSSASFYLKVGIATDAPLAILNATTGIFDTMNTNATGLKPVVGTTSFNKCTVDGRNIEVIPVGGDLTAGTVEITLTIARNDFEVTDGAAYYSLPSKEV